jgi:ligand-binding sensor domain-containing protein/serine phosphatase RsbU (regulator of sigma subunit)
MMLAVPAWGQPLSDESGGSPAHGKYTITMQPPQIFATLSVEGGLPQIDATAITQDPLGFLWVGTQSAGLARYDGHQMRFFQTDLENPRAMHSSFVTQLEIGSDGRLWIGTGDMGLSIYDSSTDAFTHYRYDEDDDSSLSTPGVTVLYKSPDGTMWVGGSDGVLNRFDPQKNSFQRVRILEEMDTEIAAITGAEDGFLWIGTHGAGLLKFDIAQKRAVARYTSGDGNKGLSSDTVNAIVVDQQGTMWIGTENGLNRFDSKKGTFEQIRHARNDRSTLFDDRIRVLFEDRDGVLWVGTEGGLHKMNKDRRSFVRYLQDPTDPINTAGFPRRVTCAYQDRAGVLYFGSLPTVYAIDSLRMKFQPYSYASRETETTAFIEGEPGVIWATTFSNGLIQFDFNKQQVTAYTHLGDRDKPNSVRIADWILALHMDKRGALWFGGPSGIGLVYFNPRTGAYKQYLHHPDQIEGLTSNSIQKIVEGPDGSLWVGTWGGGLNRFYPRTEAFMDFLNDPGDPSSLSSDHIYTLRFDNKKPAVLWVGTARGGLNRFDIEKETATRYSLITADAKGNTDYDTIRTIHQEEGGVLWLGTEAGTLVRFDPDAAQDFKHFSTEAGIPSFAIYGILPDDQGRLWLTTNGGGLSVFDIASQKAVNTYTTADGLTSNEANQNGYFRRKNGELMFAKAHGFHTFDPKEIEPEKYTPPVVLTSFQLFNKEATLAAPIWTQPTLELNYTDSVFSFEFSALSFAAPDNVRYAYKMDGLHDWIESSRRFVTYTNIDGGNYTFRVKAANRHGVWGEEAVAMRIQVAQPPWKTWWAYSLYILVLIGILLAFLRYQARKVESLRQAHRLQTVEQDLALTGAVQAGFLPNSNRVQSPVFRLHGFYRPADRASGDWWWYEEAPNKLSILVGDVTGHGPGPAMVTAAAATAFRIQGRNGTAVTLSERLRVINEEVLRVGGGHYQMTMSAIELDGRTGRFVFHSAGGQPIMRLRPDSRPKLLPCPGTPLGTESFNLGRVEGTMSPGERMLIYTDGIPELQLANGRLLGMRRFSMICERTSSLNLEQATQQIVLAADMLRQNMSQDDDWTFAMVEWSGQD